MTRTKQKLVDCCVDLMLDKGFGATSVDAICCAAGVSKGAFFHHFKSKEEIAAAATECFARCNEEIFGQARSAGGEDPLAQLRCLLNLLEAVAASPEAKKSCLVGTLSQEVASASEPVQRSCCEAFDRWDGLVAGLLAAAKERHPPTVDFDPGDVATMLSALVQGAMVIGKARQDDAVLLVAVRQFRGYLDALFSRPGETTAA